MENELIERIKEMFIVASEATPFNIGYNYALCDVIKILQGVDDGTKRNN